MKKTFLFFILSIFLTVPAFATWTDCSNADGTIKMVTKHKHSDDPEEVWYYLGKEVKDAVTDWADEDDEFNIDPEDEEDFENVVQRTFVSEVTLKKKGRRPLVIRPFDDGPDRGRSIMKATDYLICQTVYTE